MRSVRLDEDLEQRLTAAAKLAEVPASEIIREAVRQRCDEILGNTLADRLADVIGSVHGGKRRDSRKTGKAFTELLLKKRKRRK